MTVSRFLLVAVAVLLVNSQAMAVITIFSGQDNGASTAGPFPNSTAASAAFQAAAGPLGTITFENQPDGYNSPFLAAAGVTATLTGPNYGAGFSGISSSTLGNLYGFNITSGGSKWLGFAGGTAMFSFANPISDFGFWYTGVQTIFTSSLTVGFSDGTAQTLNVPINQDGGASYFGFTDPGALISSVTIANLSNDAWGIDDVSYNISAVPEPSTYLAGLLLLAPVAFEGVRRLRKA